MRLITLRFAIILLLLTLLPVTARSQELDPGAYWALPNGLNVVTTVAGVSFGDVSFDPSLPVEEASARIGQGVFVFTRALDIAGRSSNIAVQLPIIKGHLEGILRGVPQEANRIGLADPRIRFAVNLYGAPSMTPQEFVQYRLKTVIGASVTVVPPLGNYDDSRLINIGSNRWAAKPELGFSQAFGPWVFDTMLGLWLFTDNDRYYGNVTKSQDPIYSTQFHLTYRFRQNIWLAGDANFYVGGRTAVDGDQNKDNFKNSRVGATFSAGINRHSAFRASLSFGAFTTIGGDFVSAVFGYNYAW
jgi:hypothetical protein